MAFNGVAFGPLEWVLQRLRRWLMLHLVLRSVSVPSSQKISGLCGSWFSAFKRNASQTEFKGIGLQVEISIL